MTTLEQQIRRSQHRLWLDRWLRQASLLIGLAAGLFATLVLVQRLYDLPVPLLWVGAVAAGVALAAATIWTIATRESPAAAATRLDLAAGLKERISSGHYCTSQDDPFAQAVVADAEQVSASLTVSRHLRLSAPRSLTASSLAILAAGLMFLISPGVLKNPEVKAAQEEQVEVEQAKVAVKRKLEEIRQLTEAAPALEDLKEKLDAPAKQPGAPLEKPQDIRHEAVKKIDRLADAVRQKRDSDKYEALGETRKLLRRLKVPASAEAPTQKLTKALARGDFQSAKEEVNALKEQLATLKSKQDEEMAKKLGEQLNELSKQLEQLAQNKNLRQQLEQAGIKKEDFERMLENLSKKDLEQLQKQLAEKGLSQQQIDKLAKQLQQQQQAGGTAKQLANAMKQAGKCQNPGQSGQAMAGLSQAADQLSDLETLQQELAQLEAAMAALDGAKNDLDKPCPKCGGTGMG